jgi:hypothetical protein
MERGEPGAQGASPECGHPFIGLGQEARQPEALNVQRWCGLKPPGLKVPVTGKEKRGSHHLMQEMLGSGQSVASHEVLGDGQRRAGVTLRCWSAGCGGRCGTASG